MMHHPDDPITHHNATRRAAIGGAIGAGIAATAVLGVTRAQTDTTATPTADTGATPATGTTAERATQDAARRESAIERATGTIAWTQADRDAVAGQIDTATIDALLARAADLRDRAEDADDDEEALGMAWAASATAEMTQRLVLAELAYTVLPSQEAPASRALARAHETIEQVAAVLADADGDEAAALRETSQALYETAYDEHADGTFSRAALRARAAAGLASIAAFLAGGASVGGQAGIPGMRRGHTALDEDVDAPETVPAPTFEV